MVDPPHHGVGIKTVDSASAERKLPGSSSVPVVVNCANCSARSAASSSGGAASRVATIARQAGEVALSRAFGVI